MYIHLYFLIVNVVYGIFVKFLIFLVFCELFFIAILMILNVDFTFVLVYKSFADGLNFIIENLKDNNDIVDNIYKPMVMSNLSFEYTGTNYIELVNKLFERFNKWRNLPIPKSDLEYIFSNSCLFK